MPDYLPVRTSRLIEENAPDRKALRTKYGLHDFTDALRCRNGLHIGKGQEISFGILSVVQLLTKEFDCGFV